MRTQESLPADVESLRQYEADIQEGIVQFCRTAWQSASPSMKVLYGRFAMEENDLAQHMQKYLLMEGGSFMNEAITVAGTFVQLPDLQDSQALLRPDVAAHALSAVSYAGAVLGGEASEGDLQLFITNDQSKRKWRSDELTPEKMYYFREKGYSTPLSMFLNKKLKRSGRALSKLKSKDLSGYEKDHASSPWYRDAAGRPSLNREIVLTWYPLHASLLRLVDPISGTA